MNRPTQARREMLVRSALAGNDRLIQHLAEWVGRDLSGYDWQSGLPWRIESEIAFTLKTINRILEDHMITTPHAPPIEIPVCDAQRLGADVDHDLEVAPPDAPAQEPALWARLSAFMNGDKSAARDLVPGDPSVQERAMRDELCRTFGESHDHSNT
jgi:hypothetical protein